MPDASARRGPTLKQKKQRCLKKAARKRTAKSRRRARRACAARYPSRRRTSPKPVAPPALAPGVASPGLANPGGPPLSRYVSVTAREFYLSLSRPLVGAGGVTIELRNYGEDPHDLAVSPAGSSRVLAGWPEIGPGGVEARKLTLPAGSYKLFCAIEGHEQLGMKATLKVQG